VATSFIISLVWGSQYSLLVGDGLLGSHVRDNESQRGQGFPGGLHDYGHRCPSPLR
jgi:hypothetical protein